VAWGDFPHFLAYTATVNPSLLRSLIPALGWFATICEIVLGTALIAGVAPRPMAILSGDMQRCVPLTRVGNPPIV